MRQASAAAPVLELGYLRSLAYSGNCHWEVWLFGGVSACRQGMWWDGWKKPTSLGCSSLGFPAAASYTNCNRNFHTALNGLSLDSVLSVSPRTAMG